jgi:hypothetical protein
LPPAFLFAAVPRGAEDRHKAGGFHEDDAIAAGCTVAFVALRLARAPGCGLYNRAIMGERVNSRLTNVLGCITVAAIFFASTGRVITWFI